MKKLILVLIVCMPQIASAGDWLGVDGKPEIRAERKLVKEPEIEEPFGYENGKKLWIRELYDSGELRARRPCETCAGPVYVGHAGPR